MRNDWVGKRQAVRQTCMMRAEMRFLDGRDPIECTVTDISATGAALTLAEEMDIPDDFDLYIPSRSESKIAKVRRQNGANYGVAFLKSRLDDPLVMQTLLERVSRLERGYASLKVGGPAQAPVAVTSEVADLPAASAKILPQLEDRVTALATGFVEMRAAIDKLSAAQAAFPKPAASGAAEGEAGGRTSEVHTVVVQSGMASRHVPTPNGPAASAAAAAAAAVAESRQVAKLMAEISALRASVDDLQAQMHQRETLAEELASMRQSVKSLILLVSKSLAAVQSAA